MRCDASKNFENDGYEAVQIGYGNKKDKHLTKSFKGHFKKSSVKPSKVLAEFDIVPGFDYVLGSVFHVGLFNQGDYVRVSGDSKGRGFAGVIKRHNFSRQKKRTEQVTQRGHLVQLGKHQILLEFFLG